jgi:hypothetical protein
MGTRMCVLWGHTHKVMFGSNYYAVTDPDLDFTNVPKDVVYECIEGLKIAPNANKCNRLRIDNLPTMKNRKIIDGKIIFWENPINERFFYAEIDTTFAVYNCDTPHARAMATGTERQN